MIKYTIFYSHNLFKINTLNRINSTFPIFLILANDLH